jgi:hypothetical protein
MKNLNVEQNLLNLLIAAVDYECSVAYTYFSIGVDEYIIKWEKYDAEGGVSDWNAYRVEEV